MNYLQNVKPSYKYFSNTTFLETTGLFVDERAMLSAYSTGGPNFITLIFTIYLKLLRWGSSSTLSTIFDSIDRW